MTSSLPRGWWAASSSASSVTRRCSTCSGISTRGGRACKRRRQLDAMLVRTVKSPDRLPRRGTTMGAAGPGHSRAAGAGYRASCAQVIPPAVRGWPLRRRRPPVDSGVEPFFGARSAVTRPSSSALHRALQTARRLVPQTKAHLQHQRGAADQRERIRHAASRDVRRRTVHGLVVALLRPDAGAAHQPERTHDAARLVAEDVALHVLQQHHAVELRRIRGELKRRRCPPG